MNIPYPLYITEDRYSGEYSGAKFLAFNMDHESLLYMDFNADDVSSKDFWDNISHHFTIGKGDTPEQALENLISLLNVKS